MENNIPNYSEMQEQSVDVKALFYKFLNYWYLFLVSIILVMLIAYLFNRYTEPVYKVKSTILIKEEKGGMSDGH